MSPTVSRILVSPIKGLTQCQILKSAPIGKTGQVGIDRRFWFQLDGKDEVIVNGKWANRNKCRRFYRIRAKYDELFNSVTLSLDSDSQDMFSIEDAVCPLSLGASSELTDWMSTVIGRSLTFHANRQEGRPDDTELKSFTLLSEASAAKISEWFGFSTDQAIARLRPTIVVDGFEPFEEYRLLGGVFKIGDATFEAVQACTRCSVPTANPDTGELYPGFQKRFGKLMRPQLQKWTSQQHWREEHGYYATINTRAVSVPDASSVEPGSLLKVA